MTAADKERRGESVDPEVRRLLRFATTQIEHKLSGDVARWFADVGALLGDGDVPRTAEDKPACNCNFASQGHQSDCPESGLVPRPGPCPHGITGGSHCSVCAALRRERAQPSERQIETPPKLAAPNAGLAVSFTCARCGAPMSVSHYGVRVLSERIERLAAERDLAPNWRAVAQAFRDATAHEDVEDFDMALEEALDSYNKAIRAEQEAAHRTGEER